MREVVVHIYDATNSGSEEIDNRFHKDGIGPIVGGGGVFHSAIQVIIVSSDVSLCFVYCVWIWFVYLTAKPKPFFSIRDLRL